MQIGSYRMLKGGYKRLYILSASESRFFFVRFVALAPIGDQIPQCGTWLDRDVENKSNLTCTMKILNSSKSMGKVQKGDEGGITYIARKERERERGDTNNATSQVQRPSME